MKKSGTSMEPDFNFSVEESVIVSFKIIGRKWMNSIVLSVLIGIESQMILIFIIIIISLGNYHKINVQVTINDFVDGVQEKILQRL